MNDDEFLEKARQEKDALPDKKTQDEWLKKMRELFNQTLSDLDDVTDVERFGLDSNQSLVERDVLKLEETIKTKFGFWKDNLQARGIQVTDDVWDYFVRKMVSQVLQTPKGGISSEDEMRGMIDQLIKEIFIDKKYPSVVSNGKTYIGYKSFDPKEEKVFDTQYYPDDMLKEMKEMTAKLKDKFDIEQSRGVYDMECRNFTLSFCEGAGSGTMPQFLNKAPFFLRRGELIRDAHIYKFQDKITSLLVEHNKNDIGFRPMPQKNMWIDVSIPFGDDVVVTGIHLHKIKVNNAGDMSYQVYDGDIEPVGFDEDGISVFYTGISKDTSFYSYFSISKINTEFEERKKKAKYYCPHCNSPMIPISPDEKHKVYCDLPQCSRHYQKGAFVVYDMTRKDLKKYQNTWKINDVWTVEQRIKLFVCNLLDFFAHREVKVEMLTSFDELKEQNKKRAKRGKAPLLPIHIIRVSGHLERKVNIWRRESKGSYEIARNETTVDGHYRRFWDKSHWSNVYALIKDLKADDEIKAKLEKHIRKDKDDHVLPEYMQYKWDAYYKVIYLWIEPFKKFEGEGQPIEHIHVIDGVDDE